MSSSLTFRTKILKVRSIPLCMPQISDMHVYIVEEGDRVAQLIIERIYTPEVMEVQDLDETLRGAGGFGSTGGHGAL